MTKPNDAAPIPDLSPLTMPIEEAMRAQRGLRCHRVPKTITIDGPEDNVETIKRYNKTHRMAPTICQVRFLNDLVQQNHRSVKRFIRPIAAIELIHLVNKRCA